MAVKKLYFYLAGADVILWSERLTSKTFLHLCTLIAKVNNWGVKISNYCIKFKIIKDIKNNLADTLLRLTDHELMKPNPPEKEGYEYVYSIFLPLSDMSTDM